MYRFALLATLAAALWGCEPTDDLQTCDANCSYEGRVVSVEFFGGLCASGPCTTTLDFSTPDAVELTWATVDGEDVLDHVATADVTEAGLTALDEAEAQIGDTTFDETYGCPGCDDGSAMALSLWGAVTRDLQHTQWQTGSPPSAAEKIEALALALRTELTDCAGATTGYTESCSQEATARE